MSEVPKNREEVEREFEAYSEEHMPLKSYAEVAALFNLIFAAVLLVNRASGRKVPDGIKLPDILLLGVASHKLSWIVANDAVTSPIRAPFTRLEEKESPKSLQEEPRGQGLRRSLGELLTCHFCLGLWISSFFAYGLLLFPAATRLVGGIFAVVTVSDFLHQIYQALLKRA